MLTNNLQWSEGKTRRVNGRIIYGLDVLLPNSIWIRQGNGEWISIGAGLLPQPHATLPSFIMMIYGCSLCPDLIFQAHVRCGSLGRAFTINKQTLFTWLILQEAMRLKHLEPGIHLPHTSKYHQDAIDIYWAQEKTAGVDAFHYVRQCLITTGWMDWVTERPEKGSESKAAQNKVKHRRKEETTAGFGWAAAHRVNPHCCSRQTN